MRFLILFLSFFVAAIIASTADIVGAAFDAASAITDSTAATTCTSVLQAAKIVTAVANGTNDTMFQEIAAKVEEKLLEQSRNGTFMTACARDAMARGDNASASVFVKQADSVGVPIGSLKAEGGSTTVTIGVSGAFKNNVGAALLTMSIVSIGMMLL